MHRSAWQPVVRGLCHFDRRLATLLKRSSFPTHRPLGLRRRHDGLSHPPIPLATCHYFLTGMVQNNPDVKYKAQGTDDVSSPESPIRSSGTKAPRSVPHDPSLVHSHKRAGHQRYPAAPALACRCPHHLHHCPPTSFPIGSPAASATQAGCPPSGETAITHMHIISGQKHSQVGSLVAVGHIVVGVVVGQFRLQRERRLACTPPNLQKMFRHRCFRHRTPAYTAWCALSCHSLFTWNPGCRRAACQTAQTSDSRLGPICTPVAKQRTQPVTLWIILSHTPMLA